LGAAVLPKMNSREMERYCSPLTQTLWDASKAERAFTDAANAVDAVSKGNFDSDSLRTQPFTEKLKAHCEGKRAKK
jgi:hypothetical protein